MIEYCVVKKNDLSQILEHYKQLHLGENPISIDEANSIWDRIEQQDIKYFAAKENDKIIASCFISIIPNFTRGGKSIGFIENVITDKEYRKRGIGKKIMEMAIAYAKEKKCYQVVLKSDNSRTDAHRFYQSIGFDGESKKAFVMKL
jgi:ribosomal protein S18 acetylase RimI-like enzyme